jgi:hypothetical protein
MPRNAGDGCEHFDATQGLVNDGRGADRLGGAACVPAGRRGGFLPVPVLGGVRQLLQVDEQPPALPGPSAALPEQLPPFQQALPTNSDRLQAGCMSTAGWTPDNWIADRPPPHPAASSRSGPSPPRSRLSNRPKQLNVYMISSGAIDIILRSTSLVMSINCTQPSPQCRTIYI